MSAQKAGKSRPPRPEWWDKRRRRAFRLVVQGGLTGAEIAAELGVCRRTLGNWKRHPSFRAALERANAKILDTIIAEATAATLTRMRLRGRL